MNVELYILLKVKGRYNHSLKEEMIYKRLKEPDIYSHDSMIYQCKNNRYIESRGEYNKNSGFQHRDLFLTPYGERRLKELEKEYLVAFATRSFVILSAVVALLAGILQIWQSLSAKY